MLGERDGSLRNGDTAPQAPEGGVEFRGAPDNVYDSLLETKRRVLYGLHPPEGIRSRYLLQFFLVVQVDDNHRLWPVKAGEIRDVDKGCASAVDRLIRHDLHTNPSKRVSPRIITLPGFAQHRARFAGPSHPIPCLNDISPPLVIRLLSQ